MTSSDKPPSDYPLWKQILYIVLAIIVIGLLIWGADSIGLLGFLAGTEF